MTNSRRDFLKLAAKYSVGGVVFNSISLSSIAAMRRYVSPNEKIDFGLIGANGMGWADMRSILKNSEANCIAICDVDANVACLKRIVILDYIAISRFKYMAILWFVWVIKFG